ncbi:family 51 glycoside hydrolase [Melampsora americana]|nr:family 51 glycoside hydrolase [Melampsora americana]
MFIRSVNFLLIILGNLPRPHAALNDSGLTITLSKQPTHTIPNLYGMMYEDINHAGDGGYYAELIRNRALQAKNPWTDQAGALEAWSATNGIRLRAVDLSMSSPLSEALPNALKITVLPGKTGTLLNSGYWGIKVDKDWTYRASFYAKLATKSQATCGPQMSVQLTTVDQSQVFVERAIRSPCLNHQWQRFSVEIRPGTSARGADNAFGIKFSSTSNTNEVIHITLASLFPPTYKNRPNGVRVDLAEATAALKRSFFRWGGNNIEGYGPDDRWIWHKTVGPLTSRPGRKGNWNYVNTDGKMSFGLFEVLQFCEDLNMEFIASVWSGLSLAPLKAVSEGQIDSYIQEGIDMLNFIVGPVSTKPGALRASLGHSNPFKVRYVEVGNEDFFDSSSYTYRWKHFAPALMKAFPRLKFIATTGPHQPELSPSPAGWDIHSYKEPGWYVGHTHDYDSYARNGQKIFQLEFASNGPNPGLGPQSPTQEGAVGEAAYMTGFERRVAYAPTLCNTQITEASQWMFATYLGDRYLPSNLPSKSGNVAWSATMRSSDGTVFLKVRGRRSRHYPWSLEFIRLTIFTSSFADNKCLYSRMQKS